MFKVCSPGPRNFLDRQSLDGAVNSLDIGMNSLRDEIRGMEVGMDPARARLKNLAIL